jgi:hypothetical protein
MTVVCQSVLQFQDLGIALDARKLAYQCCPSRLTVTLVVDYRGLARFRRRHGEFLKGLGFTVQAIAL